MLFATCNVGHLGGRITVVVLFRNEAVSRTCTPGAYSMSRRAGGAGAADSHHLRSSSIEALTQPLGACGIGARRRRSPLCASNASHPADMFDRTWTRAAT